ncbi:Protein kinase superfamily protein [Striga hermonthica]|uniref:Protein kinase superfamily protein n=1 Tax=Striga hermonthica TaxID=68872 RepID=A0A9N7NUJ1_STRHE|nr:Protein kinase superfamily protein [Striga hermonthica]
MAQSMRRYQMVGDYVMGKQIGAGSFSTVWHARHRVNGTEVAVKEIVTSRLSPKLQESLKSEIFILKRIDHPNIIRLHDMVENLLLSTDDRNSVLKIADFGFARSLQPRGLAETLCGSPLYMAPEIMQLQKYDAKADLWSVGAILFQLVTGKTPFTGNNQIELLQNIIKSTELQFPRKAVDLNPLCKDLCRKLLRRDPVERLTFEEFFNHPYLSQKKQPDEFLRNRRPHRISDGFSRSTRKTEQNSQEDCFPFSLDDDSSGPDSSPSYQKGPTIKSFNVTDSLESIDRDYVIVTSPLMDFPSKTGSKPRWNVGPTSTPVPISQESADVITDALLDQPSTDHMTRISALRQYADTITELVNNKTEGGKELEAFSIQLVILAIWKQALHVCHTQAASALEESPSRETTDIPKKSFDLSRSQEPLDICSQIENTFLREVERAEELAKLVQPGAEMPDAMELLYQSALALGRHGAVDELMDDIESAVIFYSKAAHLLMFLLIEAPCLILNPPLSLTNSDRFRIKNYIDVLNNRQSFTRSQRMAVLNMENQPHPS